MLRQSLYCQPGDAYIAAFTLLMLQCCQRYFMSIRNELLGVKSLRILIGSNYTRRYWSNFLTFLVISSAVVDNKVDEVSNHFKA